MEAGAKGGKRRRRWTEAGEGEGRSASVEAGDDHGDEKRRKKGRGRLGGGWLVTEAEEREEREATAVTTNNAGERKREGRQRRWRGEEERGGRGGEARAIDGVRWLKGRSRGAGERGAVVGDGGGGRGGRRRVSDQEDDGVEITATEREERWRMAVAEGWGATEGARRREVTGVELGEETQGRGRPRKLEDGKRRGRRRRQREREIGEEERKEKGRGGGEKMSAARSVPCCTARGCVHAGAARRAWLLARTWPGRPHRRYKRSRGAEEIDRRNLRKGKKLKTKVEEEMGNEVEGEEEAEVAAGEEEGEEGEEVEEEEEEAAEQGEGGISLGKENCDGISVRIDPDFLDCSICFEPLRPPLSQVRINLNHVKQIKHVKWILTNEQSSNELNN